MAKVPFSVREEIKKLDNPSKRSEQLRRGHPEIKVQRVGVDYVQFYLQDPLRPAH